MININNKQIYDRNKTVESFRFNSINWARNNTNHLSDIVIRKFAFLILTTWAKETIVPEEDFDNITLSHENCSTVYNLIVKERTAIN